MTRSHEDVEPKSPCASALPDTRRIIAERSHAAPGAGVLVRVTRGVMMYNQLPLQARRGGAGGTTPSIHDHLIVIIAAAFRRTRGWLFLVARVASMSSPVAKGSPLFFTILRTGPHSTCRWQRQSQSYTEEEEGCTVHRTNA